MARGGGAKIYMNPSLDTNILMRYILEDVPDQYEKAAGLINDISCSYFIPDMVVSEIVYNLQTRKIPRKDAIDVLYTIFNKKNIMVSEFVLDTVLPFFAKHPALSFVDCYSAFEAERKGCVPLLTFDRKLANQHRAVKMVE